MEIPNQQNMSVHKKMGIFALDGKWDAWYYK